MRRMRRGLAGRKGGRLLRLRLIWGYRHGLMRENILTKRKLLRKRSHPSLHTLYVWGVDVIGDENGTIFVQGTEIRGTKNHGRSNPKSQRRKTINETPPRNKMVRKVLLVHLLRRISHTRVTPPPPPFSTAFLCVLTLGGRARDVQQTDLLLRKYFRRG